MEIFPFINVFCVLQPDPSANNFFSILNFEVSILDLLFKSSNLLYRCLLRILDTFGTEPVFNYKKWKPERDDKGHDYGHTWGNWGLNPRQFMTMYRKRH